LLSINNAEGNELSYIITDVWGRRITQQQLRISPIPQIKIPIAMPTNTNPGIYFIEINNNNNTHTLKLIVQ
jgi:hypothetical protein